MSTVSELVERARAAQAAVSYTHLDKIRAIVISDIPDNGRPVAAIDETSQKIADNLVQFLKDETKAGRLPTPLPPLQSGVGSVANAVLAGLKDSDFENINIYSEVLQLSLIHI